MDFKPPITALDRTTIDALLKGKWNNMKSYLQNGNIDKALTFFHEASRGQYTETFNILSDQLPTIAASMQDIEIIQVRNNLAEYRIKRAETIQGNIYDITFHIYFSISGEGWKIVSF